MNDPDAIFEAVMNREREGSTGLEKGVAIPHAKWTPSTSLSIVIGISREGVNFEAQDGKPSHLFLPHGRPDDPNPARTCRRSPRSSR